MKIIHLGLITLLGVMCLPVVAAEPSESMSAEVAAELREEITSPLGGDFSAFGDATGDWSQDYGGLSGNSDGYDGFETLEGKSGITENQAGEFDSTGRLF